MPNTEGKVTCVTHVDSPMIRQPGHFMLYRGHDEPADFDPEDALKLRVYRCTHCSYVETYVLKELG